MCPTYAVTCRLACRVHRMTTHIQTSTVDTPHTRAYTNARAHAQVCPPPCIPGRLYPPPRRLSILTACPLLLLFSLPTTFRAMRDYYSGRSVCFRGDERLQRCTRRLVRRADVSARERDGRQGGHHRALMGKTSKTTSRDFYII